VSTRWPPVAPPPPAGDGNEEGGQDGPATAAAVAGLAREVEALRRGMQQLQQVPRRVEELAGMVVRLAEQAARPNADAAEGTVTWLDLPGGDQHGDGAEVVAQPASNAAAGTAAGGDQMGDGAEAVAHAEALLARLIGWMRGVFLRYADAVRFLPACWLWHPEVVEELVWLRQAWLAAYADPEAPVSLAGDWHDRQRPGVVRRIRDYAGLCSIEAHRPDGGRCDRAPAVPLADAAGAIACWWATDRGGPAPAPTAGQLSAALGRPARGRR
jgi:hypothetical protein